MGEKRCAAVFPEMSLVRHDKGVCKVDAALLEGLELIRVYSSHTYLHLGNLHHLQMARVVHLPLEVALGCISY